MRGKQTTTNPTVHFSKREWLSVGLLVLGLQKLWEVIIIENLGERKGYGTGDFDVYLNVKNENAGEIGECQRVEH